MIEGSQLDDYGHFNQLDMLMKETHDFDRTIGAVMKWAAKDGETLVVVTADHETGGLTLLGGDLEKGTVTCHFQLEITLERWFLSMLLDLDQSNSQALWIIPTSSKRLKNSSISK